MIAFYELKSNFILYNYLIGSVMLAQMRTMRDVKQQDWITVLALHERMLFGPSVRC